MMSQLTVDEMIVRLQNLSALGKGEYKMTAVHSDGKPHYFNQHATEVFDEAKIVELHPYGDFAHRDY